MDRRKRDARAKHRVRKKEEHRKGERKSVSREGGEEEEEGERVQRGHSSHDIKRGCRPLETRATDSKDPGRSAMKSSLRRNCKKIGEKLRMDQKQPSRPTLCTTLLLFFIAFIVLVLDSR